MAAEPAGGAAPAGAPHLVVRPFAGPVVYRNVRVTGGPPLWRPARPGLRWNPTYPALYTSFELEVSLAERLKHSAPTPLEVVVGVAHVVAHRVADLTHPATLQSLRTTGPALVQDDYAEPHRIANVLHPLDLAGLLVPAAIGMVRQRYPRIRLTRDGLRVTYDTPRTGVNLVLFPNRFEEFRELARYRAVLQGLTR